jgi:hypothetical protein
MMEGVAVNVFRFFLLAFLMAQPLAAQGKSRHDLWENQLQKFVSKDGKLNYKAWKQERSALDNYIDILAENPPQKNGSKNDLLAYWINAYNALTVQLILDHYPVESIKDISKPWETPLFTAGETDYTLGDIEHEILRKQDENRIHFAINCASASCPNLYRSAFKGAKLEYQLETVTRQFFHDPSKNIFESDKIQLSKILLWFIMDFGFKKEKLAFLSRYSPVPLDSNVRIRYLPYDWSLNE